MGARRAAALLSAVGLVLGAGLYAAGSGRARGAPTTTSHRLIFYGARVRVSGKLVVTFTSGPGCQGTDECNESGTLTWTPGGGGGGFEVLEHGRLEAFLAVNGGPNPSSTASVQHAGGATCVDSSGQEDLVVFPVSEAGGARLRFGMYATHGSFALRGPPISPNDFVGELLTAGPFPDEPTPTRCGGPLPSDFLPLLPSRVASLRELRRGPTTIDLSGTASFTAGGLTGTARSTIVLHIHRLRGSVEPPYPPRGTDRVVRVGYRVLRVAGSIGVGWSSNPASCVPFDACGLTGRLTVRPGPGRGHGDIVAYDCAGTASFGALRRAVGLAPGQLPGCAQASGIATWSSDGSVSAVLDRAGVLACSDSAPLSSGVLGIDISGTHARIALAGGDFSLLPPVRDFLRTRCQDPALSDLGLGHELASITVPVRVFGQRTITLHLTRGVNVTGSGFTWASHPNLTIVLRRTRVDELSVDSSIFET